MSVPSYREPFSGVATSLLVVIFLVGVVGWTRAEPVVMVANSASEASKANVRTPPKNEAGTVRRKRGGPESGSPNGADLTPEGQNDLIKVLQPGLGQKSK